ncbi:hypothetical protein HPP92_020077 [Vanilla planifolia]|uniref:MHD domain-containing protein n=1 Tax=Vanilla planifolia TaxID=51239 RepID=A0A835Q6Z8_VANPL|nr:hypothetical protein HPP92_020077 [Vanilla planifolia]
MGIKQILSFVPPDGEFKLASYRVKKLKNVPIYVKPQLTSSAGNCQVNVLVGIRNDPGKVIENLTVQFQLPSCVGSADLKANHGTVNVLAEKGMERLHGFPTFLVGFKIVGVAFSGLQVDKLEIKNVASRPYKGFRALTKAGGIRSEVLIDSFDNFVGSSIACLTDHLAKTQVISSDGFIKPSGKHAIIA